MNFGLMLRNLSPRSRQITWCLGLFGFTGLLMALLGAAGLAQAQPLTQRALDAGKAPIKLTTLKDLLQVVPWDTAQQGALLVVSPGSTYRVARAANDKPLQPQPGHKVTEYLPAFERSVFSVGSLSVIAPSSMVLLADQIHEAPNLYDGLPRALKVEYLLATLTNEQWGQLGREGLGLGDLKGEQQNVFRSLLPNPFKLLQVETNPKGFTDKIDQDFTLSDDQRSQVRLHVFRTLHLTLPVVGNDQGGYPVTVSDEAWHRPNAKLLIRPRDDIGYGDLLYGVTLRKSVANRSKMGDLKYRATKLNVVVALNDVSNLGDLVKRVAAASGLELYADQRVATLPLFTRGEVARAGDILQALALAVTGTFRKVGPAYVLTSDVAGIGTRVLRIAEWETEMQREMKRRKEQMIAAIAAASKQGGGMHQIGFAADDRYAPTADMLRQVDADPKHEISYPQLTPQLQTFVTDQARIKSYGTQQLAADPVKVEVNLTYGFQLPGGAILRTEEVFGSADVYEKPERFAHPGASAAPQAAVASAYAIASVPLPEWARNRFLVVAIERPNEVENAVRVASRLGFNALVLRTENQDALHLAIKFARQLHGAQLQIYAEVAPFALTPGASANLDLNLLGELASEAFAYQHKSPNWAAYLQEQAQRIFPHPVVDPAYWVRSAVEPFGPGYDARLHRLIGLAMTDGLAGIFFYGTTPAGYVGQRSSDGLLSSALNGVPLYQRGELGYTEALRLAFLRNEATDPLDIAPVSISLNTELPFFPMVQALPIQPGQVVHDAQQTALKWDQFRSDVNREALARLYDAVHTAKPDLSLYIETRPSQEVDITDRLRTTFVRWSDARDLPMLNPKLALTVRFSTLDVAASRTDAIQDLATLHAAHPEPKPDLNIFVDLGAMPSETALQLAAEYISARQQP